MLDVSVNSILKVFVATSFPSTGQESMLMSTVIFVENFKEWEDNNPIRRFFSVSKEASVLGETVFGKGEGVFIALKINPMLINVLNELPDVKFWYVTGTKMQTILSPIVELDLTKNSTK